VLTERQLRVSPPAAAQPRDRCRHGRDFDRATVACPTFQRSQFVASTSYGKPLGVHVACSHLVVGELSTNQFYPRCALGTDLERMRWLAMMGPGKMEVMRSLTTEFESVHPDALRMLIAAKAAALADAPDSRSGRVALAALVREFIAAFTAFVTTHAERITEIGVSPADLSARATRVLGEWQHSARLDLPGHDGQSAVRPDLLDVPRNDDVVNVAGLLISRASRPASLTLVGSIDQSNLDTVEGALEDAASSGQPVTIDLSAVTFCSVAGLRMLMSAAETGTIRLEGMQSQLLRALAAAGLVPAPDGDTGIDSDVAS
jgi:anti-anti-sigma regulatory factor